MSVSQPCRIGQRKHLSRLDTLDKLDGLDTLDRMDTLDELDKMDTLDKKSRIGHLKTIIKSSWTDMLLIYNYINIFCPACWTLCPRDKKLDTLTMNNCPIF